MRAGLRECIDGASGVVVVGEAATLEAGLRLIRRTRPQVVLLDKRLPDGDGVEAIPLIRAGSPRSRIVVLTIYGDPDALIAISRAGAEGYVHKSATEDELVAAIIDAAARPLGTHVIAEEIPGRPGDELWPDASSRFMRLTPRQREVVYYVAQGLTNAEIGQRMGLVAGTVKINLEHAMEKLELSNRTQVAVAADRYGLHRLLPPQSKFRTAGGLPNETRPR